VPDAISSCYRATISPDRRRCSRPAEAAVRLAKFLRVNRDQLLKLSGEEEITRSACREAIGLRPDQTHDERKRLKSPVFRDPVFPHALDSALRQLVTVDVIQKSKQARARSAEASGPLMQTTFSFAAASGCPNSPCSARWAAGGSASPQGSRSPRLRSPALHGVNVPHAFHAVAPPPPTAHKRALRPAFAFRNSSTPPVLSWLQPTLCPLRCKIRIARLGRQLVDGIWAPVGWRIGFVKPIATPKVTTADGIRLHSKEIGAGTP